MVIPEASSASVGLVELDPQHNLLVVADLAKRLSLQFFVSMAYVGPARVLGIPHDAIVGLHVVVHLLLYLVILYHIVAMITSQILAQANVRVDEHWEHQLRPAIVSCQSLVHFRSYPHGWSAEEKVAGCRLLLLLSLLKSLPLAELALVNNVLSSLGLHACVLLLRDVVIVLVFVDPQVRVF